MRDIAIRWLSLTGAVILTSYLLDGIHITGFLPAACAAAVLGMFNVFFRPVILILTLPLNVLTLGFLTFIINAIMLLLVSGLIPGFEVQGLFTATIGALVISLISWLLNALITEPRSGGFVEFNYRQNRW